MKLMHGHWTWNVFLLLLVLGIAYAVVVPNLSIYQRSTSAKNECINNLKQIDAAIQIWVIGNKRTDSTPPELEAVVKFLKKGKLPKCPSGGTYSPGKTYADAPVCSKGKELGHTLP